MRRILCSSFVPEITVSCTNSSDMQLISLWVYFSEKCGAVGQVNRNHGSTTWVGLPALFDLVVAGRSYVSASTHHFSQAFVALRTLT